MQLPPLPHSFLPPKPNNSSKKSSASNLKGLNSFGVNLLKKAEKLERDRRRKEEKQMEMMRRRRRRRLSRRKAREIDTQRKIQEAIPRNVVRRSTQDHFTRKEEEMSIDASLDNADWCDRIDESLEDSSHVLHPSTTVDTSDVTTNGADQGQIQPVTPRREGASPSQNAFPLSPPAQKVREYVDDFISHEDTNPELAPALTTTSSSRGTAAKRGFQPHHILPSPKHKASDAYISPQSTPPQKVEQSTRKLTSNKKKSTDRVPSSKRRQKQRKFTPSDTLPTSGPSVQTPRISTKTTIVKVSKQNGNNLLAAANHNNLSAPTPPQSNTISYAPLRPSTTKRKKRSSPPAKRRTRVLGNSGPFYSDPTLSVLKPMSQLRRDMQNSRKLLDLPQGRLKKSPVKQREVEKNDEIYRFLFDYNNNITPGTAGAHSGVVPKPLSLSYNLRRNTITSMTSSTSGGITPRAKSAKKTTSQSAKKMFSKTSTPKRRHSTPGRAKSAKKRFVASRPPSHKESHGHPYVPRLQRMPIPEDDFDDEFLESDEDFVEDLLSGRDEDYDDILIEGEVEGIEEEDGALKMLSPKSETPHSVLQIDSPSKKYMYDNFLQHMMLSSPEEGCTSNAECQTHQSSAILRNPSFWRGYLLFLCDGLNTEQTTNVNQQDTDFVQRHVQARIEEMGQVDEHLRGCLSQFLNAYEEMKLQNNKEIEPLFETLVIGALPGKIAAEKADTSKEIHS